MHNSFDALLQRCILYRKRRRIKVLKVVVLVLALFGALGFAYFKGVLVWESEPAAQAPAAVVAQTSSAAQSKDANYSVMVDEAYLLRYAQSKQETKPAPVAPIKQEEPLHVTPPITPQSAQNVRISTKKVSGIEELTALHERDPRYETALKIAQHYFDQQEYLLASSWAKRANILDKEAQGAWLLYAKSEYARGNKERAMEILRLFLSNKSSTEAQTLLMTWSQGS